MTGHRQAGRTNTIVLYLALLGVLGLGMWLRWRFIQAVRLYPDEFVTLLAIEMIGQTGLPVMPSGLFYEHGLLFSYLGAAASRLDSSYLTVRYVSLICSVLTLLLTFWVGRRWFSPFTGLVAAAGLAIAPTAIHWSGRARMYALFQLLVLLTLYLAYEGVNRDRATLRWSALLVYLAATLTQFAAVALAPPLVLAAAFVKWTSIGAGERGSSRPRPLAPPPPRSPAPLLRNWAAGLELAALAAILIIAFLVKRAGQPKSIEALEPSVGGAVTGLVQVFTIYSDFSFNLIQGWQDIAPFYLSLPALIFAPFALLAIITELKRIFWPPNHKPDSPAPSRPSAPALFLGLILIVTTFEVILFVSPERRDEKYLFMLLPALLLLGAYQLARIKDQLTIIIRQRFTKTTTSQNPKTETQNLEPEIQSPNLQSPNLQSPNLQSPISQSPISNLQLVLGLIFITLILIVTWPGAQALLTNTGDDYESAFAYVQEHWQAGDKILTGTPAAAAFYLGFNDFYSVQRRGGYDYRILEIDDQAVDRWLASPAVRTEADLHQTLSDHNVWLVLERWGLQREYYDLPFLQQLLAQTDYETQTQGIFVLRSKPDPRPVALDPAYSVQATFGDQLQLQGFTLEPEQPQAGQSLRLTLYWQAIAPVAHDYTVFVHLRRSEGGNVAQADHRPLGALYPTTLWPVGETIRESSELLLPAELPPGDYELWTGLYLLETGERLPVQNDTSGENAVLLGRVRVE